MSKFKTIKANDPEYEKRRIKARSLCLELNNLDNDQKGEIYKKLFYGSKNKNIEIWSNFFCEFGDRIIIEGDVFIHCNCMINDTFSVTIGNKVKIGANTAIHTTRMNEDPKEREEYIEIGAPVTIGNDVYIGTNVLILPGVTIEQECYIGDYAVLCEDVTISSGSHIGSGVVVAKKVKAGRKLNKQGVYRLKQWILTTSWFINKHSLEIMVVGGGLSALVIFLFKETLKKILFG